MRIFLISLGLVFVLGSCTDNGQENKVSNLSKADQKLLESKKQKLLTLKEEMGSLKEKINTLEAEIAKLNPDTKGNAILVSTHQIKKTVFSHYVDLRGSVASRSNILISSETMGKVIKIYTEEGARVQKGTTLIVIDYEMLRNNLDEVNAQLELAQDVYKRQKKLWERNIGTEMKLLESKTQYETLAAKKAVLLTQLKKTTLKAPFDGIIDQINIKEGEILQPGFPAIRMLNPKNKYIAMEVSEVFVGQFKKGDTVAVFLPGMDTDKTVKSTIKSVGNVIKSGNRTFAMEVNMPITKNLDYKPNQMVIVKLIDYQKSNSIVIPSHIILSSKEGKFIYVVEEKNGGYFAKRVMVEIGKTQSGYSEVLSGLTEKDRIIDQGYREVSDGAKVQLSTS